MDTPAIPEDGSGFAPLGCALALIAGSIASLIGAFAYFVVVVFIGFDVPIYGAGTLGFVIGAAIGVGALIGGWRSTRALFVIGLLLGVTSYTLRWYLDYQAFVRAVVANQTQVSDSLAQTRAEFLASWKDEYPPGGFLGYLRYVAQTGFVWFDLEEGLPVEPGTGEMREGELRAGIWAWSELIVEVLLSGLVAAAIGNVLIAQKKKLPTASGTPPEGP